MNKLLYLIILLFLVSALHGAVLENQYLKVTCTPSVLQVLDKSSGYLWKSCRPVRQPVPTVTGDYRNIRREGDRIVLDMPFGWNGAVTHSVRVEISIEGSSVAAVLPVQECNTNIPFIFGFSCDRLTKPLLVSAENCEGHLYDALAEKAPGSPCTANLTWYPTDRLAMNFLGLCSLASGAGCMTLIETSDDGLIICEKARLQAGDCWVPRVLWLLQKNKIGYERRISYHFFGSGGYNAMCKAYRQYLRRLGYIRTFGEKRKINPSVDLLAGAVSVWGTIKSEDMEEMKAKGVKHAIIQRHGDWVQSYPGKSVLLTARRLGYLAGEYNNYVDIYPMGDHLPAGKYGRVPEDCIIDSEGCRLKGWFDGTEYCSKRCPSLYIKAEKEYSDRVLQPYTAGFFDVLTAQDLTECFNPLHPLTKTQARQKTEEFLEAMSRRIVTGSERGVWWAAKYADWFEGMESSPVYWWRAEYLEKPRDITTEYSREEYYAMNLDPAVRVPLWQLVFHDCCLTTCYWGDSNDFVFRDNGEQKNKFNILYGTMPIMWSCYHGAWLTDREFFYDTVRDVCSVTEELFGREMLGHYFLSEDRLLQKTEFDGGISVYVNFGEAPKACGGITLQGGEWKITR